MTIEQFRDICHATPFRPFVLHLADGREIPVKHRDFVGISPSGRTITVYQPDESLNIIDLLLVTDIENQERPPPPTRPPVAVEPDRREVQELSKVSP